MFGEKSFALSCQPFILIVMSRLYPIGMQSFDEIRKGGYLYVDKGGLVYQLVTCGKYYFLSRPQRFGKSLLISTLEACFQGKRELFSGLAVENLEQEWTEYPVFHHDLNARKYENEASLAAILNQHTFPFASGIRKLFKLGVNFSNKLRGIEEWKAVG